ncbi:MAG: beta-phosphoglucomutase family hydrolase [Chitinivibrionales bacterium]|nr:beta-phosphoglucomutase family hydrolase [Chitinivibrionales bacterium]MBD3395535.1 beta-phosphoglucomutase family hydrolase [Chitinivibrionales bacterium]
MSIGAIFDWDGVIIDSAAQHEKSWELIAAEEGFLLPEGHFRKGFGMKNELIIPNILEWTTDRSQIARLSGRKEELYRQVVRGEKIGPLPGVMEFLEFLQSLGIPCAIGSSTGRENIDMLMSAAGLAPYFETIITGEDVSEGKPDPQVFLLAAQGLGCRPSDCVVFEDAPAGIAAAHNGGMKAVGVATTHPAYELTDAEIVVQRLDELGRSHLDDLFLVGEQPEAERMSRNAP